MSEFSLDYSASPVTPTPATRSIHPLSSPLSAGLPTPPDSFRKYSDDLRTYLTNAMQSARKDIQLDRPPRRSSTFDVDYGYDEDPFDVHARMVSSMRKEVIPPQRSLGLLFEVHQAATNAPTPAASPRCSRTQGDTPIQQHSTKYLDPPQPVDDDDENDDQFFQPRPAFLQFRRSSQSVPSLYNGNQSISRIGTDASTPSSEWSESSFEAIKPDDILSMYGTFSQTSSPVRDLVNGFDRSSISSIASGATVRPLRRPSLLRPSYRTRPYERLSRECSMEPEFDPMGGRTISEDMVLTAGLMSQRGRPMQTSMI